MFSRILVSIIRLIPRLPLDIAADAGGLVGRDGFSGQYGFEGGADICAGDRPPIARAAVVQLAAINQPSGGVEEVEVRRAGGAIGFGHVLGFVEEIGEGVSGHFNFLIPTMAAPRGR